jgi:hypothetical protein
MSDLLAAVLIGLTAALLAVSVYRLVKPREAEILNWQKEHAKAHQTQAEWMKTHLALHEALTQPAGPGADGSTSAHKEVRTRPIGCTTRYVGRMRWVWGASPSPPYLGDWHAELSPRPVVPRRSRLDIQLPPPPGMGGDTEWHDVEGEIVPSDPSYN